MWADIMSVLRIQFYGSTVLIIPSNVHLTWLNVEFWNKIIGQVKLPTMFMDIVCSNLTFIKDGGGYHGCS